MVNKVFAGFVIAFWAAMMAALVRVDVFPKPMALQAVSTERVLKKIFSNPEPVRLDVYYTKDGIKTQIGFFRIDIQPPKPMPKPGDPPAGESPSGQDLDSYAVSSDLRVKLWAFGMPSRLFLRGESVFSRKLELERFDFATTMGDGQTGYGHAGDSSAGDGYIKVVGDDRTKKVQVTIEFGDFHDKRSFDFNQIKGAGFASVFGLPGMANLGFLGGGGPASSFAASSAGEARPGPETTTYLDHLDIAGNSQRVYLIYSKIDDQMWTKIWVDDSGQVLKVSTSLGLEMQSDIAFGIENREYRGMRRGHRENRQ